MNLYEYMNDAYIDPILVNVCISHAQFEIIHPYNDGNGRLGRALIPIQMTYLSDDRPILYLSEIIELNKIGYQRALMNNRRGDLESFIIFFMQCIIDQYNNYIKKLEIIKNIYKEDYEKIKSIKGSSIHIVFPIMMNKVVFTKKYIEEQTGLATSTISRIINQLLNLGILVKVSRGRKKEYEYDRIYKIFIGNEIY
ncbi:MAG: Fic family protein [Peptostreptococcaceae bacterium]